MARFGSARRGGARNIEGRSVCAAVIGLAVALLTLGLAGPAAAQAPADPLSAADKACLGCHGAAGMEKKAANGDVMSLQVDGAVFGKSVHAPVGCTSCHADVKPEAHPSAPKEVKSARAYAVAATEACRGCHDDKFKQWEGSIHASLARDGNAAAPICSDCHQPHAVIKGAAEVIDSVPCKGCHSEIYDAYAASVHGKIRTKGNAAAPLCSGCHTAHDIKAAAVAMADGHNNACSGCHADAPDKHRDWLPNAGLHLDVVSCAACHSPKAHRRVDLQLFDSGTRQRVTEQKGVPLFEGRARAADGTGQGLDALALWNLLRTFNREGMEGKTTLRGRLEVRTGVEAHQLAAKSDAISDCKICHQRGSDAFEMVTVSVAGPDGRPIRYGAQKEVLSSVISIDAISGFYAIGGTRIELLDYALILAILAGIAVPLGHLALGWFVRRALRGQAAPPPAAQG